MSITAAETHLTAVSLSLKQSRHLKLLADYPKEIQFNSRKRCNRIQHSLLKEWKVR